ncbi:MAG: phosphatase PAP2 family protein [Paludibacteraceae bacterium]|nr:phosphatase PAP2 family protein [Paludibacteraceae bacterium]
MLKQILDIVAKTLSVVLYPLFVPTYGIALFCYAHHMQVAPLNTAWMAVAIGGTLLLTCVIPLTAILLLIRRGNIKDLYIEDSRERTIPYLYTTLGFAFWCYLLIAILHTPLYINIVGVGATISIGIITLINRSWKISAHMTAMGGLFGGFLSYCLGIGAIPMWGMTVAWLSVLLLVMYARLWLNAHTPAQVICGLLLGLSCTFIPNMIIHYYGA